MRLAIRPIDLRLAIPLRDLVTEVSHANERPDD